MSMKDTRRIRVSFACNDPDNGSFTGRVDGVNVESLYLTGATGWDASLEHRHVNGVAITVDHKRMRFRIHRVWFPFVRSIPWFGNWCWEAFEMKRPQAKRLLMLLREKRCWSCDEGQSPSIAGGRRLKAHDMARCRICNRTLTSEESIAVMIGPECLERAIADQPDLARLRAVFGGATRRVKAVADERTGDLFEEMESGSGEG